MLVALTVAVATVTAGTLATPAYAEPPDPASSAGPATELSVSTCPSLYALGIQGTGESSPDAAPTTDTGMLSTVFRPLMAAVPEEDLVQRAYVPYESSFGGVDGRGATPYSDSVRGGLIRMRSMANSVAQRCPETRFAVVGYSQGAHVASLFAQEVGQGQGAMPAEKIAGVALIGDPTRTPGAPLFPGDPERSTPDRAPGTGGAQVDQVAALSHTPAAGGGIAPERDVAENFGTLTGRVASFCAAGDLSCDVPEGAAILKAVAGIVGQAKLSGGDPIASLTSVAQALAFTSIKTATKVINEDVQGTSLATLNISPKKSISERLADAADPRTPLDIPGAMQALLKVGMIGLNAVTTVVRTVLNPASIAELATAGLANPPAALLLLGTKLLGAIPQLIPPTTGIRLVNQAFDAVVDNIHDNRELLNITTWTKYWDTVQRHQAYGNDAISATGETPTRFIADWFAAAARDLAAEHGSGHQPVAKEQSAPMGSAPGPSAPPAGGFVGAEPGASPAPAPSGTGQFPFGTGVDGASSDWPSTSRPDAPATTGTDSFSVN